MPNFRVVPATVADAPAMATNYFESFHSQAFPQWKLFDTLFPNTPSVHAWYERAWTNQMQREPWSVFLKVVDTDDVDGSHPDGKLVGLAKWRPPGSPGADWGDFEEPMDIGLCNALFGAMAENKARLMEGRPYWYLEMLGVNEKYARQGVGAMLVTYGCDLADRAGVECYVDGSPGGKKLYERHGFEEKATWIAPVPFDSYVESFMVRPKKS